MAESVQIAGSTAASDAARDWQAVRDSADIQYAPIPPYKPPETPDWLKSLAEWLRSIFEPLGNALGLSWPVIEKLLIGLAVLGVLFIVWRIAQTWLANRQPKRPPEDVEWQPDRQEALALLDDADRLACVGRYGEAAHLLLQRSVRQISDLRPDWLRPASTAREIARLAQLPDAARLAFGTIAERVERAIFALRDLDADDWQAARDAYARFALADITQ